MRSSVKRAKGECEAASFFLWFSQGVDKSNDVLSDFPDNLGLAGPNTIVWMQGNSSWWQL